MKEEKEIDLTQYRKTVYNEQVTCVDVQARVKNNKTQIVLILDNDEELTYKLEKETQKKYVNEELSMQVLESETAQVRADELNTFLPEVFKKIAKYIKENGSIVLNVSYRQTALAFDGQIVIYKYMQRHHVETIYSKKLYKDDERLQKQIKWRDNQETRAKGKSINL